MRACCYQRNCNHWNMTSHASMIVLGSVECAKRHARRPAHQTHSLNHSIKLSHRPHAHSSFVGGCQLPTNKGGFVCIRDRRSHQIRRRSAVQLSSPTYPSLWRKTDNNKSRGSEEFVSSDSPLILQLATVVI